MKKNLYCLLTCGVMLLGREASCGGEHIKQEPTPIKHPPRETVILKLPRQEYAQWKESYRIVDENNGLINWIPSKQTPQDATDVIRIRFEGQTKLDKKSASSIEEIVLGLRKPKYDISGEKIVSNLIEKNQNDLIYELTLLAPSSGLAEDAWEPVQHHIVRVFETDNGLHYIEAICMHSGMSFGQRKNWIKTLRECTSVVPCEAASKVTEGISLADKFKDSLDLGEFRGWKNLRTYLKNSGHTRVWWIPPGESEDYMMELLEVITTPNLDNCTIEDYLEYEKIYAEEKLHKKIEFHILKKTSTEVIYTVSQPDDLLRVIRVARGFISGQGLYSICYSKKQPKEMTKEEISQIQGRLEAIKVRAGSG